MFEIFVVLAVVGGLWLALMLAGLVFKLVFGLVGGLFSVFGALVFACVGGVIVLALLPVLAFALAPLWLPLLALGVLAWLVWRGPCRPVPVESPRYGRR